MQRAGKNQFNNDEINIGWIKLKRTIQARPVARKPKAFALFIHCLAMATHKFTTRHVASEIITLTPGQFICGRKRLADASGLTEKEVRGALQVLEVLKEIKRDIVAGTLRITMLNWHHDQDIFDRSDGLNAKYKGWVRLDRSLFIKGFSRTPKQFVLFIHCLLSSHYKKAIKIDFEGEVMVNPGQFVTTNYALQQASGLKLCEVRSALKSLVAQRLLGSKTSRKRILIGVRNWKFYNGFYAPPKRARKRWRGTRLKIDWEPSNENIAFANSQGLANCKIKIVARKFKNYWMAVRGPRGNKRDWDKAWCCWVLREINKSVSHKNNHNFANIIRLY